MPTDLRTVKTLPYFKRISLTNTNAHEIYVAGISQKFTVGSENTKIYAARNGAIDGEAMPVDKAWIPAGNLMAFDFQLGTSEPDSMFVSAESATALDPAIVIVIME